MREIGYHLLKIGIDGRVLGPKLKGIGRYIWELCKALDGAMPEAQFFVYSRTPIVPMPSISTRWLWRCDRSRNGARIPNSLWSIARLGYLAQRDNVDVFWGAAGLLPLLGLKTRKVLTVYDFVYKLAPETASKKALWTMRLFFGASVSRADEIVSISLGTARRLKTSYNREVSDIVKPGLAETIQPKSADEIDKVLQKYGIEKPYLLYVGTLEARKGLHRLVPAFVGLLSEGQLKNHRLVLAGDRGWKDEGIERLVRSHKSICPIGFVDDDSLAALYTGAEVFVFPSSYEGFGMPVLEARACGTPVVTTDVPELREAGGEDTIYVPPTISGVRSGIIKALNSRRPEPISFADYSWNQSARILASVLSGRKALPLGHTPRNRLQVPVGPPETPLN